MTAAKNLPYAFQKYPNLPKKNIMDSVNTKGL